ncbi:MAG: tRNA (adenosine(37)-N6)-dimethylallyltransferase MiaA [Devosiaceae bacterium]|nr:tRNA (adenosine(37)-N6)-dimethylallyltransferase MiaA [Devosiaceae bacterium]
MVRSAILIAGASASGKSSLAIKKAKENNGLIINTDSMQVYSVLNLLSARPQSDELAKAEHALYGTIHPSIRFSTGEWLREVEKIIAKVAKEKRKLIFVGGTGLYFKALTDGFTQVPDVPQEIVSEIENEISDFDRQQRLDYLHKHDPKMVERLNEPDRQRVVRAISVIKHTKKSLADWQNEKQVGLLEGFEVEKILLNPDKEILSQRIEQRFESMIDQGAVEEVKELLKLNLDATLPAMKAIGVKEIAQWLNGEIDKARAVELAVIATRQYTKRQRTWFRRWL